ncbi:MAG: Hsp20/alpha crystallin family protein [Nitrospinae bacterium]|nr:Hsp20/alpha crystallin family protein [Nitrospinota bacterium]
MAYKHMESIKGLLIMQDKIGRFFERDEASVHSAAGLWVPVVDLYETTEDIIMIVELAGISVDDVKIDLWENYITIYGERPFKGKEESYLCMERSYGPFQRTFRLPASVEENTVGAEVKYGVLEIKMRKKKVPGHDYIRVEIAV